jgi:hypothetical protein
LAIGYHDSFDDISYINSNKVENERQIYRYIDGHKETNKKIYASQLSFGDARTIYFKLLRYSNHLINS